MLRRAWRSVGFYLLIACHAGYGRGSKTV
jgi:hypothetical protein